ncbi:ATP-binding protein [Actinoplanes sp. NPDC051851]|uniref:ATP-binding protein n=1 Tax=Actinoplanes sp. NPDC051851 TaxID=3154753 RepID=UPI003430F2A7
MEPPYLFEPYDPAQGDGVDVGLDVETSVLTLAVHGRWGRRLGRATGSAIRQCLSEHPATLLIDLNPLTDPRAGSVPTWTAAGRLGAPMWPPVSVLVCVSPGTALAERLSRPGAVPSYPSVPRARAAAAEQSPLTGRFELDLPPESGAAAAVRGAVANACGAWGMAGLRDRARLVASELVLNAVEHAATPITVMLSRRGSGLHVAVRDEDPRVPRLAGGSGSGLHVVHAAATSWGAMPCGTGKVVWATIHPRSGGAR